MPTALEKMQAQATRKGVNTKMATLTQVASSEVPDITREGKGAQTIQEFLDANMDAASVGDVSKNFAATLKRHLKSNPEIPVEVVTRGGTIYLKRTDGDQGE